MTADILDKVTYVVLLIFFSFGLEEIGFFNDCLPQSFSKGMYIANAILASCSDEFGYIAWCYYHT